MLNWNDYNNPIYTTNAQRGAFAIKEYGNGHVLTYTHNLTSLNQAFFFIDIFNCETDAREDANWIEDGVNIWLNFLEKKNTAIIFEEQRDNYVFAPAGNPRRMELWLKCQEIANSVFR